ncbi:MAG TPA: GNAT family N-acetyltransferase [Bryobacteraceae bacterium]|nr:GNAT family N-acetyltransferase [Bryobacteraceae bacterium]
MPAQPSPAAETVTIRQARPEDAAACGPICYDAFATLNAKHGFPCDFPSAEHATGTLSAMFSTPGVYCVVAESGGRILGSNCIDERAVIAGIGPITVSPEAQNSGAGRLMMQAVIDHANSRGAAGIRLVQAAFHNRSLSLYTKLGFAIQEPLSCVQGPALKQTLPGCTIRAARPADLDACNDLSRRIHGYDRGRDLAHSTEQGTAVVVERGGRISGYASSMAFFGHGTAETNLDMQAMIAAADSFGGSGVLIPSRNTALLRWCLAQ